MTHFVKLYSWKSLWVVILVLACTTTAWGQSRFHIDVDYHYNLGLSEKFMGTSLNRNKYKMGGHSIHLSPRYDISPLWSAGIGIGLDRYTELDYNTLPIFATVRYRALKKIPDVYAFTDLGYAIKAGDYTKGFTGSLGIGYTYMLAKHFGVNVQIAYNLKRFTDISTYIYNAESGESSFSKEKSTRHSLSFGIGLTF